MSMRRAILSIRQHRQGCGICRYSGGLGGSLAFYLVELQACFYLVELVAGFRGEGDPLQRGSVAVKAGLTWCMGKVDHPSKVSQNQAQQRALAALENIPNGNHGDNRIMMQAQNSPPSSERTRLSVDFSAVVSSHLDHISEVTGVSKAGIISGALLDALPALLARADALKKRHQELSSVKRK